MVVVTVANNRQQNSASEGKADEEEYAKEEIANAKKGVEGEVVKRVLKPNERLRSRGTHRYKLLTSYETASVMLRSVMQFDDGIM